MMASEVFHLADKNKITESNVFAPNRVFISKVDSYHGRQITKILSDKLFHEQKEEAGEELGEEEPEETKTITAMSSFPGVQLKYEIVGTAYDIKYRDPIAVKKIFLESDEVNLMQILMQCGFIVYDITNDTEEITKALNTLKALEKYLEDLDPSKLKQANEERVFVLISTAMTWARTKPVDPEDPDVPFVETDYRKRRPHPNYKAHIDLEKEVIQKGKKLKGKLRAYVVCCGITYGAQEEDLHFLFKLAWKNTSELPIISPGNNTIPLLNVKDIPTILFNIFEEMPKKPRYILAVEQTTSTQKQIVKALARVMGTGRVKEITQEDSFLYEEMTQVCHERLTVNLKMEPAYLVEQELQWQSDLNLCENITKIMKEYKDARNLYAYKILLHGPPATGKTTIAKKLCKYYDIHYVSIVTLIRDTLAALHTNARYIKELIRKKEEKEARDEEEENEEEEDEDEEEDLEAQLEELNEKLKNIERSIDESETGRLPDDIINDMLRTKLSSNACQNQGYLLDGYPKTMEQARQIFEIEENAEDEEEGEEEEEAGEEGDDADVNVKKLIMPEFIISLEASDEFITTRMMSLPESKVQGTHYGEEDMVRRLNEFRDNNTEDTSFLNIFDEIEIHPYLINVEVNDEAKIIELIQEKIGTPKGYPLTAEELEVIRLQEEEILNRKLEIERRAREEAERQAKELYEANMEEWMDKLQKIKTEEEHLITLQSKPFRDYIVQYVLPTLTRGLLETARVRPSDPIDYLAEYLFRKNPDGRMFDPSYCQHGDDWKNTLDDFQNRLGIDLNELNKNERFGGSMGSM